MGKEEWLISLLPPFSQKDLRDNSLSGEKETDMDGKLAMLVERVKHVSRGSNIRFNNSC